MEKVRCPQSTWPRICAWEIPSTKKMNGSQQLSDETFHQKLRVPGPVTVVCTQLSSLCPRMPLRAASTPSCVLVVCVSHEASPPVVQANSGASKASPNAGTLLSTMVSTALELRAQPWMFVTRML